MRDLLDAYVLIVKCVVFSITATVLVVWATTPLVLT